MTPERSNWYAKLAVAILVAVLIILCMFLVRQYRLAARAGVISAERAQFAQFIMHHRLGASDVSLIAPWMTFDYVSVTFKVPAPYLTTALGIASSTVGYPNITIGHYARMIATSSIAVAAEVQNIVKDYLAPTSTTGE